MEELFPSEIDTARRSHTAVPGSGLRQGMLAAVRVVEVPPVLVLVTLLATAAGAAGAAAAKGAEQAPHSSGSAATRYLDRS